MADETVIVEAAPFTLIVVASKAVVFQLAHKMPTLCYFDTVKVAVLDLD